jgi:hypothetical protein
MAAVLDHEPGAAERLVAYQAKLSDAEKAREARRLNRQLARSRTVPRSLRVAAGWRPWRPMPRVRAAVRRVARAVRRALRPTRAGPDGDDPPSRNSVADAGGST